MNASIAPFKFVPYLKSVLWGGDKIAPFKGIATDQQAIGESWEISGVPGHESVVAEGADKGMTLPALIEKYGAQLVGAKVYERFGNTFPLLVKIIDAKKDLSVQVHPDDELAKQRHNSLGKTEMWYIIDAEPGAKIYAGLSKQITPDDYTRLVEEKKIMDVIAAHESHAGDLFYLPAGRIHAIGAGNILAEIQETSDITYRVYDFDRRDANGNTRELHTEQAKDAIDYTVYPEYKSEYDRNTMGEVPLIDCDYFDVNLVKADEQQPIAMSHDSFMIIMCLDGKCEVITDGKTVTTMQRGETLLVPASTSEIEVNGKATLLTAQA
jgi:mannose-6-phosphate isomerase